MIHHSSTAGLLWAALWLLGTLHVVVAAPPRVEPPPDPTERPTNVSDAVLKQLELAFRKGSTMKNIRSTLEKVGTVVNVHELSKVVLAHVMSAAEKGQKTTAAEGVRLSMSPTTEEAPLPASSEAPAASDVPQEKGTRETEIINVTEAPKTTPTSEQMAHITAGFPQGRAASLATTPLAVGGNEADVAAAVQRWLKANKIHTSVTVAPTQETEVVAEEDGSVPASPNTWSPPAGGDEGVQTGEKRLVETNQFNISSIADSEEVDLAAETSEEPKSNAPETEQKSSQMPSPPASGASLPIADSPAVTPSPETLTSPGAETQEWNDGPETVAPEPTTEPSQDPQTGTTEAFFVSNTERPYGQDEADRITTQPYDPKREETTPATDVADGDAVPDGGSEAATTTVPPTDDLLALSTSGVSNMTSQPEEPDLRASSEGSGDKTTGSQSPEEFENDATGSESFEGLGEDIADKPSGRLGDETAWVQLPKESEDNAEDSQQSERSPKEPTESFAPPLVSQPDLPPPSLDNDTTSTPTSETPTAEPDSTSVQTTSPDSAPAPTADSNISSAPTTQLGSTLTPTAKPNPTFVSVTKPDPTSVPTAEPSSTFAASTEPNPTLAPTAEPTSKSTSSADVPGDVETAFEGITLLQAPLRNLVINKLGVEFARLSQVFRRPNLTNPYPDISDIVTTALSGVRVDHLGSLAKRDVVEDGEALQLLVNGVRVDVNITRQPEFAQTGPTIVTDLDIDRRRMYVRLRLRFRNVSVPLNISVAADLFPPFFSVRRTSGAVRVDVGEILVPLRIPFKLYFQKREGEAAAAGVLMPEDFVTHGASMLDVSTRFIGCGERDFMEKEVLRFDEHLKNRLELWLSGDPLASLAATLRHHLLSATRRPTTMSLGSGEGGEPADTSLSDAEEENTIVIGQ